MIKKLNEMDGVQLADVAAREIMGWTDALEHPGHWVIPDNHKGFRTLKKDFTPTTCHNCAQRVVEVAIQRTGVNWYVLALSCDVLTSTRNVVLATPREKTTAAIVAVVSWRVRQ